LLRLYKTFLSKPSWLRPTSARRLLVLRHGPSPRLQGVANVAGFEHPVQRSDYGRRDPRFDFGRRDPRFCWTPPRVSLELVYLAHTTVITIKLMQCRTKKMVADALTKNLPVPVYEQHRTVMLGDDEAPFTAMMCRV
jgi:hypothetical protein